LFRCFRPTTSLGKRTARAGWASNLFHGSGTDRHVALAESGASPPPIGRTFGSGSITIAAMDDRWWFTILIAAPICSRRII